MVVFRAGLPLSGVYIIRGVLSVGDVLFAACLAYFLTRVIRFISGLKGREIDVVNLTDAAKSVMERCYALFPIEEVIFRGAVFRRGMLVKVTTHRAKTFTGRFLGVNDDNVICVMTSKRLKPELLDNVDEIEQLAINN